METKHTPGPWKVNNINQAYPAGDYYIITGQRNDASNSIDKSYEIATVDDIEDANLIASAPELLAALEEAVDALNRIRINSDGDIGDVVAENRGRLTIAKAKGLKP